MENNKKTSVVVLISGNGSNLQAIIDKVKSGELDIEIKAVISNKADAYGLERAKQAGIITEVFSFKEFQEKFMSNSGLTEIIGPSFTEVTAGRQNEAMPTLPTGQTGGRQAEVKEIIRQEYCRNLALLLKKYDIDLVVLAGWMLVLKDEFLKEFPMKVINLHPALIPAFPGTHGIEQAFNYGAKITGVTVHFVPDEGVDTGPIILQEAVKIEENDTLESLEAKIHAVEHRLLPEAIRLISENKLNIVGRKVKILQ